eukprot:scaffold2475_cov115-Isochrysis_galbana.AAC.7
MQSSGSESSAVGSPKSRGRRAYGTTAARSARSVGARAAAGRFGIPRHDSGFSRPAVTSM